MFATRIGCCGLDCEKCDAYIATINDDNELRAKTAKEWSELNGVEILPEMINCTGCRTEGVKTYFCSELCGIRKCACGKGYGTCGECRSVGDCETVGEIHKNSPDAANNLKK